MKKTTYINKGNTTKLKENGGKDKRREWEDQVGKIIKGVKIETESLTVTSNKKQNKRKGKISTKNWKRGE